MGKKGYSSNPVGTCGPGFDQNIVNKFNNNLSSWHWFCICFLLAVGRFHWKNLPPTVDESLIEKTLIMYGSALFWRNKITENYYVTPSTNTDFDINGNPTHMRVDRWNKFHGNFNQSNAVLIFNDYLKEPFIAEIEYFVKKFVLIDKAKDINIKLQCKPKAIVGSMDNINSLNQMLNNIETMNMPYLKIDANMIEDLMKVQSIDLGKEIILKDLEDEVVALYHRYLTRLGYNNVNIVKKERLVTDEAQSNIEGVLGLRDTSLLMRKKACKEINKLFGLNIDVEFVTYEELTGQNETLDNTDEDKDGNVSEEDD